MKLRSIVSVCLLTLPLTCFATTVYLPVLAYIATAGQSLVIDFTPIKPLTGTKAVDWKIDCTYEIEVLRQSALAVVRPELMGTGFSNMTNDLSDWSGKTAYGNLIWYNLGQQKETFVYHQTSEFSPWHLSFTNSAPSNPVTIRVNTCVAISEN